MLRRKTRLRLSRGVVAVAAIVVLCAGLPVNGLGGVEVQYTPADFRAENKYALIVGINDYISDDIIDLQYAVRDAEALYEVLVDPRRGAFSEDLVVLLTDKSDRPPTRENIGKYLKRIALQAQEDDLVLIFFSGHGYEEDGKSYLASHETDLEVLEYSALDRDVFIGNIDDIVAKKVIVILDACHAGGITRGGKGAVEDMALSDRYYDQFTGAQGRAFIASCSGGQLSFEDPEAGHGAFTNSLVKGLSGEADYMPEDGLVTLFELRRFLEEDVSNWARLNGKEQQPQINLESAYGDIPVALNSDYLDAEAIRIEGLQREAKALTIGLAGKGDLTPDERAEAIALLDKLAADQELSADENQMLELIKNLVEGSIGTDTYRSGIRGLTINVVVAEGALFGPSRQWFVTLLGGGYSYGGDNFSGDFSFAPAIRLGYSFGRWDLVAGYTSAPGSLEGDPYVQDFDASLLTVGPRINFDISSRLLAYAELALGGYLGSEVRNDQANIAVDIGGGIDVGISSGFAATAALSWVFSNATMTPPADPEMAQGLFLGVGITYTRIK